jgi:hypothetical protein
MLRNIIIGLGAFVAILPYLGLPHAWDSVLFTLSGLTVIFLLLLTRRPSSASSRPRRGESEDNTPPTRILSTKHIAQHVPDEHTIVPEESPRIDTAPPSSESQETVPQQQIAESPDSSTETQATSPLSSVLSSAMEGAKPKSSHSVKKRRTPSSLLSSHTQHEEKS